MRLSTIKDTPSFVLRQLCTHVNSQLANAIIGMDDFNLSKVSIEPSEYSCAKAFASDYLLVSYLSKYKGLQTGIDTKRVALSNFAVAEEQCRLVNKRLRRGLTSLHDSEFLRAQRLIAKLLGPLNVANLTDLGGWGPGATFEFPRTKAYLDTKIADFPMTVTKRAAHYLSYAIASDDLWAELLLGQRPAGPFSVLPNAFDFVEGCRIVTVPKNAKTDRTIGIEPRGNMFLQKGVGNHIRSRLKRVGVDLDDQSYNQRLAAKAVTAGLSTIDLSMASDTVSLELVYQLLPIEWASYLDNIRSQNYCIDGEVFMPYQKFSSMGNGFTFELESMIFWSLVRATVDDESTIDCIPDCSCAVYGDDIILPFHSANVLISLLAYSGFTTNADKTFLEGRFFESCGRHYFDDVDVTPIYQKELVCDLSSHIRFYNRLTRYGIKNHDGDKVLGIISPILKLLDKRIRNERHPQLPFGAEGDDGYLSNYENARPVKVCRNHGWKWQVVAKRPGEIPANDIALYAHALRQGTSVSVHPKGWVSLVTRDDTSVALSISARWLEPTWEFALDL